MFMLKSTHERLVYDLKREISLLKSRLEWEEDITRTLSAKIRELQENPVKMKDVKPKKVNPQTARRQATRNLRVVGESAWRKSEDTTDMLTPFVAAAVVASTIDSSPSPSNDSYSSGGGGDFGGGGGGSDF